jgi:hypothetical protein
MQVAKKGLPEEVVTGRKAVSAKFDRSKFILDYLTEPTGFMDLGFDLKKVNVASRVQDTDKAFVIAYPHFNVNGACHSCTLPQVSSWSTVALLNIALLGSELCGRNTWKLQNKRSCVPHK